MSATTGALGWGAGITLGSAPVHGLCWRQIFPGEERQLGPLRRWLALLLPERPARDDVISVATELASNAIKHTASGRGGWFTVEVTQQGPSAVRVAVADSGAPDGPRVVDDELSENGRGLMLVQGLSARTGVSGDQRGRVVWADVAWGNMPAPQSPAPDPYEATIRSGLAGLARRFTGIPIWFGRSTMQWWALVDRAGRSWLVTASSPHELEVVLTRALQAPVPREMAASRRDRRSVPGARVPAAWGALHQVRPAGQAGPVGPAVSGPPAARRHAGALGRAS
jgi:anti-sigma regulatory factor (Ser/Thr protein kinase)